MNISTSFVQDQKHATKSAIFVPIQPSQIATVLQSKGFDLVHLKSGHAKTAERAHHQTTIARYRSQHEMKIGGLNLDLVFKVPHLYGSLQAFLGTYRQVCSNGLVVGTKFFDAPRVRHTGDALHQLDCLINTLVGKHEQLVDTIQEMGARTVTPSQVAEFIREAALIRLGEDKNIINVNFQDLSVLRRHEDKNNDAFSVLNVVQENMMRFGLRYQSQSTNEQGQTVIRNMTARPVTRNRQGETESTRSVDMNASLWDAANRILMGA